VLSAILIVQHGYPVAMTVAAVLAVLAGLLIIPLKNHPPVFAGVPQWRTGHPAE